jgi:hypothetical protein
MNRMLIMVLFLASACTEVSPYNCPDIDEQYKPMHHKDAANLDRKKYKFKKTKPTAEKRREFGTDRNNLEK